jgi:hypothetical protein
MKLKQTENCCNPACDGQPVAAKVAESLASNPVWQPPRLFQRIVWRLQSLDEGFLSERALRRARELARDQDIRVIPPPSMTMSPSDSVDMTLEVPDFIKNNRDPRLPFPGTVLSRKYKGHLYQITVLPYGFEYEGQVYRSLSAVAYAIKRK